MTVKFRKEKLHFWGNLWYENCVRHITEIEGFWLMRGAQKIWHKNWKRNCLKRAVCKCRVDYSSPERSSALAPHVHVHCFWWRCMISLCDTQIDIRGWGKVHCVRMGKFILGKWMQFSEIFLSSFLFVVVHSINSHGNKTKTAKTFRIRKSWSHKGGWQITTSKLQRNRVKPPNLIAPPLTRFLQIVQITTALCFRLWSTGWAAPLQLV